MAIYRGTGGTGDTSTGEDVFGSNSSITDLNGLTGGIQTPTYIAFDTDAGHTALVGEVAWNSNEGTLDVGLNGGSVTLQVGQEVHYRVTNQSGLSIPDGTLVVYSGTTGNSGRLLIEPYNGTQASKYIIGLTTETIANGADGYVTHFGKVRGIQTNGVNYGEIWNDADELYPSPLGLTNVLPQAPAAKQVIAIVINAHPSNGEVVVNVQGHTSLEDDELVQLTSLTNNDILQYDSADSRFENRSLTSAGIQPTLVSGSNIKTVNSISLVGSGDVQVQAYDANLTSFVNTFTLPTADSTNGFVLSTNGAGTLQLSSPGGIPDGDKGDITVSTGGTVWTVDNDAITYAKIQNVSATDRLLGRSSVGAGDVEEVICTAAGRALIDDIDASAQRTTLGLGVLALQGDGDKGDITVSGSGATWSIDNNVVSPTKLTTGAPSWNATGNTVIGGTTTNDNATAGKVGEYIESSILIGSAISLTTNVAANVTSISLTAGDWDVSGLTRIHSNSASTSFTQGLSSISLTSATIDPTYNANIFCAAVVPGAGLNFAGISTPVARISVAATTTVYLVARAAFTGGTAQAYGIISARRAR